MQIEKLSAGHGWLWIRQGNYLFKKNRLLWIAMVFTVTVGMLTLTRLPLIGDVLFSLLFPVIYAGLLMGCQALEHDKSLEIKHLLAGFKQNSAPLVMLGGINLLAQLMIFGVMSAAGGSVLVGLLMSSTPPSDPAILAEAMLGGGLAMLLGTALGVMLMMANQFAPMLVLFNQQLPLAAMRSSFRASTQNLMPLSVYGSMMILFAIFASLPMMLGWLILLPVMLTSLYAAYRGIFPSEVEMALVAEPALENSVEEQ